MAESKFILTGNPFVDTGLHVLTYLAKLESPEQLTLDAVKSIYKDGLELTRYNSRLKSFTMVFGTNGPLTQTGYRPAGKKKELSAKNIKVYTDVLSAFLREAQSETTAYPLCEVCGKFHCFDFDATVRQALTAAAIPDRGAKYIGREWFPLAGSLGNDAQSLPSASRALSICARCLFAVHYMPLGLMLMQGRLVCFQSGALYLVQDLVSGITEEYLKKLSATKDKIDMIGKKEGTTAVTRRLLSWMSERRKAIHSDRLSPYVSLTAWLFTNSGADPDCTLLEIPNNALQFLREVEMRELKTEMLTLLAGEDKRPEYQLLTCVQQQRDYSRLYPFKSLRGASPELFTLYHQVVLGESATALDHARRVAKTRLEGADKKQQKALCKAGALNGQAGAAARQSIRRIMADMAEKGEFSLNDYDTIFPTCHRHPIHVDYRGWNTIGYYLSHPNADVPDYHEPIQKERRMTLTHPKITEAATLYFRTYITERGPERFNRDILEQFHRGKLGVPWLREVFARLAEKRPGFTYGDWDEFVQDENGRPQAYELLFQMRLALANLYREHTQNSQIRKEN